MTLTATELFASYQGTGPVLRDASCVLPRGSRIALLGANGSGKTTLLRCLSGAHRPDSGQVRLDDQVLTYDRPHLRAHRRQVQLVLQDPDDQLFSADVTQDVAFGPLNLGLDESQARARVREALDLLGITHLADRATHQLSHGERKRVTIAGAVAMRPTVLLLDEPTAGLDPHGVAEMRVALDRLTAQGTTIALATHDIDFALSWAEQAAVVVDGGVRQGPIATMLRDAALLDAARLRQPWQLELAVRLGLASRAWSMDELVAALGGPATCDRPTA
ncbi:MAG: ATP-binding cassette domain-containing protein [Brooklawnia sp.]|nr:ATP-binding cassette domain-containing protein [Brooklawnia sp.]